MNQINPSIDTAVASAANKAAYISAATTGMMGWVGSNSFAVISGFVIALATFLIGWYYKSKDNARREQRHELAVQEQIARIEHLRRTTPSKFTPLIEDLDTEVETGM